MCSIEDIKQKNILVVGEVMLDIYFYGTVDRISPEAPVPVLKKISEKYVLGGAGNVASNLAVANQNVYIMSFLGNDDSGEKVIEILRNKNINCDLIVKTDYKTITKTRFLANNNQQLMRLDVEDSYDVKNDIYDEMIYSLLKIINSIDIIIVSDYMKGFLTEYFLQKLITLANTNNKKVLKVLIDVKDKNINKYKNAYLLKPNLKELTDMVGKKCDTLEDTINNSKELLVKSNAKYVLTTCGKYGMVLVSNDKHIIFNSNAKEVYDVTGAGDTAIAYLTLLLANGIDIETAVHIANVAAGIQVGKVGTSDVSLIEVFDNLYDENKIWSIDNICELKNAISNKKIVFTNGCFDVLHIGHISYLKKAKELGDILIVGLNSDASVKKLKGENRPINNQHDRAKMLLSLKFVDYVVIFNEDTPLEIIKKIKPNILVKGEDYKNKLVVGKDFVESYGGKCMLLPFVSGFSTTNILSKI